MQGSGSYQCPTCVESFDKTTRKPLRLECGHASCLTCFRHCYNSEKMIPCGRCAVVTYSGAEVEDYSISALVTETTVNCFHCRNTVATKYCLKHDKPHCENCRWTQATCKLQSLVSDEDFCLRHHLYSRILLLKEQLQRQLSNSPLVDTINNIRALTNQQRLTLLEQLFEAELQLQCFCCQSIATHFAQPVLSLLCAAHAATAIAPQQLALTSRDDLLRQLKYFVYVHLKAVNHSAFNPDSSRLVKVMKALKSEAAVYDIANAIYILKTMKEGPMDYSHLGYAQCPMCYKVSFLQFEPMAKLPCNNVVHLVCGACYQANRAGKFHCPFDDADIPPYALVMAYSHF